MTPLTPRYVSDVINHVASLHVGNALVRADRAQQSIQRYRSWRDSRTEAWHQAECCEFVSFFAVELVQGALSVAPCRQVRVRIALDFIIHVILENNLRSNIWRVEYDVRTAFMLLVSADATPDQLLTSFSVGKW